MLIVFAGLPGVGKSSIGREVARRIRAPLVSADSIASALAQGGATPAAATAVAHALVEEQLKVGLSVVVDAVNATEEERGLWRALASKHRVPLRFVECTCSDEAAHRVHLETRRRNLPGLEPMTWDDVLALRKRVQPWKDVRLVLDTASSTLDEVATRVIEHLRPH